MDQELMRMLIEPENYVCTWRDGELYIQRVEPAHDAQKRSEPAAQPYRTQFAQPERLARVPEPATRRNGICD